MFTLAAYSNSGTDSNRQRNINHRDLRRGKCKPERLAPLRSSESSRFAHVVGRHRPAVALFMPVFGEQFCRTPGLARTFAAAQGSCGGRCRRQRTLLNPFRQPEYAPASHDPAPALHNVGTAPLRYRTAHHTRCMLSTRNRASAFPASRNRPI